MLLHETGAADVVDPLGGSYYLETLTTELEQRAQELLDRIDGLGGMVAGVQSGFLTQLIGNSSWDQQQQFESNDRVMVGVNEFVDDDTSTSGIPLFKLDPGSRERQLTRLAQVKRSREGRRVLDALREIELQAPNLTNNLMPAIEEAVRARCTVGEISNVLRQVWGEHRSSTTI
jgi:methylmalonyl-CoA mutase N-terminal domain/subunit